MSTSLDHTSGLDLDLDRSQLATDVLDAPIEVVPLGIRHLDDIDIDIDDIDIDDEREPGDGARTPRPPGRWRTWRPSRPTRSGAITTVIGLLTTLLSTWNLSVNGMANTYYAAAVRSGALSWKAMFFGSIDPGSFITVDKPPAALWVMSVSARIFGFSTWSMLLPEALAGLASVLILHRLVRRWKGDTAAHLAALAFALTPVAALMFRFNNPDAFLTLTCLAAAWATWRAVETGRTKFLVAAGALVGLGFMTKMLQAFLILPALAVVYLWAGPPRLRRRLGQLLAATGALIVSSGWWVAVVALWPASSRPYIGSTSDNSILSLVFGYNGLGRLFGSSSGGGGQGANFGGTAGWLRLFDNEIGGQIAWLLPLAVVSLAAGMWITRRARRTDLARAGWVLWGLWALVCAAVFSLSQGTFHPYYTVQLAPALAALAGAGTVELWQLGRQRRWLAWVLPATVAATCALAVHLLARTPSYHPWLRPTIAIGGGVAVVTLLVASLVGSRVLLVIGGAVAAVAVLAGPTAYTLTTVTTAQQGSTISAGPAVQGSRGGFGGKGGPSAGGTRPTGAPSGTATTGTGSSGTGTPGTGSASTGTGQAPTGASGGFGSGAAGGGGESTADRGLVTYLEANRDGATYLVATFGSQSSASIIIASGQPVVTIGGFTGSDPAPTLAQFEQMVASGQVRYVLVSGGGGGGGQGGDSGISSWVTSHGTVVDSSLYGGSSTGTLYLVTA